MYKKQLRTSIIIGIIEIITFSAIIAIHHFDTAWAAVFAGISHVIW